MKCGQVILLDLYEKENKVVCSYRSWSTSKNSKI